MIFKKNKKCRICGNSNLKKVISLGNQFIQGKFKKKINKFERKIPLNILLCHPSLRERNVCGLLQLENSVNKNILYNQYYYRSGVNLTMKRHLNLIARKASSFFINKCNVLDIGCNDGTLLSSYPKSYTRYGLDPSQIVLDIKKEKQLNLINDFFPTKHLEKNFYKNYFDIITSIAMFYDLDDPSFFVKKIKNILSNNGIWILELSYMPEMLKLNSYDTICHEHLEYYSLSVLQFLFKKNFMKIFKIELNKINGGSIRCFVTHENNVKYDKKKNYSLIKKIVSKEKKLKLNTITPYKNFQKKIYSNKFQLRKVLLNIKKKKKIIHIYGASTKGNTILQFCKINNKFIKYAADRNPYKVGLKTLGSNILIIDESKSRKMKPDYYLVLPWHFQNEFVKREREFLKNGGKFIFPLPNVRIY
jgi:2-polyprenyl-3-methyl-5-hydroxy-6-metoxy-1,4-benzoquinol methylase